MIELIFIFVIYCVVGFIVTELCADTYSIEGLFAGIILWPFLIVRSIIRGAKEL